MVTSQRDRRQSRLRAKLGNRRGGFFSMIVEPYRQIRLGLMILLLNIVFGLCIGGVFAYYVYDIYDALSLYHQFNPSEDHEVWQKYWRVLMICLSLVALFFILSFWVIIRYTHQIYGPLVSLHKHLDELLSGEDPPPLTIRSTDQLQSLTQKINELVALKNEPDQKQAKLEKESSSN